MVVAQEWSGFDCQFPFQLAMKRRGRSAFDTASRTGIVAREAATGHHSLRGIHMMSRLNC